MKTTRPVPAAVRTLNLELSRLNHTKQVERRELAAVGAQRKGIVDAFEHGKISIDQEKALLGGATRREAQVRGRFGGAIHNERAAALRDFRRAEHFLSHASKVMDRELLGLTAAPRKR